MFACSFPLPVYNAVLCPSVWTCLLTRVCWPYMLSCIRLLYVICTLCYVQWLDHVCLLVSTDRICCHKYVCCMWSVYFVTSMYWTMFSYFCQLTVYIVMCTSAVFDQYTVLRPETGPCLLNLVYWPYMMSYAQSGKCVMSSSLIMLNYSRVLSIYVVMCTSGVCDLYTVLCLVIGPCLLTRVCWPNMLWYIRLLHVIYTLCNVYWLGHVCLLLRVPAVYVFMCKSAVLFLYTVLRPVIGPYLPARVSWPYLLLCARLLYVISTLYYVQWLDHVHLLVATDCI